jgi:type IV pilus assembly protein PilQ
MKKTDWIFRQTIHHFIFTIFICIISFHVKGQDDRFQVLEKRLKDLSTTVPGLSQKVEYSVNNGSLGDFLQGIATANNLNFNVDPSLTQKVSNNFTGETVITILLFLSRQYSLDMNFIGSIINIYPFRDPLANMLPPPKELKIQYNDYLRVVTFDLHDDTLINVAKKLTQLTNENIIVLPEISVKRITGYVQNMPLTDALEKLALTNSFKINQTNDNVIVLESLKADEEMVTREKALANSNYSVRKINKGQNTGSSSIEVNDDGGKVLVNLNVSNAQIKEVIKSLAEQAKINYFEYSEIIGTTTANVSNMEFEQVLGFILQGTKYTYSKSGAVYLIGDRNDEGLRAKKFIQLHYRSADSLIGIIPMELRQGVEIKEFKELNGFLLSGSLPSINEIESFVKQVDKVIPLITLEVIILDVSKGKTVATGISAGTSDSTIRSGGTLLGAGGLNYTFGSADINRFLNAIGLNNVFNLGRVSPGFYVQLTALENNSNVTQRQTPKLSTLNGHTANLSIGNTQYYSISTQNVIGSLTPQTVVTQQFIPVSADLIIDITPFVAGDDEVTMNLSVSISNFTSTTTTVNQPPPTSTSKFKSILRVKNEEMIVLGGIERDTKSESGSGIPFLSRIPVLKWIFSSRSKSSSKVVSIVFIKPTIIYQ